MKNRILKLLLNIMAVIVGLVVGVAICIPFLYAGHLIHGLNLPLLLEALIVTPLLFVFAFALGGSLVYGVNNLYHRLYWELFGEPQKS